MPEKFFSDAPKQDIKFDTSDFDADKKTEEAKKLEDLTNEAKIVEEDEDTLVDLKAEDIEALNDNGNEEREAA